MQRGQKMLMTAKEYIDSLRQRKMNIYLLGEKVENPVDHPIIRPSINAIAMTYKIAHEAENKKYGATTSNLTGKPVSRFNSIFQNTGDLVNKIKMQRVLGNKTACCFQRCVGMDAINAIYSTTYDIDQKYHTEYHTRFNEWLKIVQEKDLCVAGAMTDPKGDRGLAPSEQPDPDMYVHIVERNDKGIVIRGAKAHQTGALNVQVIADASFASNRLIYAASSKTGQDIMKWTIGSSRAWTDIFRDTIPGGVYGLVVSGSSLDALEFNTATGQSTIWQCLAPTSASARILVEARAASPVMMAPAWPIRLPNGAV